MGNVINMISGGKSTGQYVWEKFGLKLVPDGKTWIQSNITSGNFNVVYCSDGLWVAGDRVTNDYDIVTGGNGLYYSEDGKTWTQSNITSGAFNSVYYSNNVWVAGGRSVGLYYSEDGKNWVQSNITSGDFYSVYYGNGLWVAAAVGDMYYSINGKSWTKGHATSGTFYSAQALYYAAGIWVASDVGNMWYSTDGMTWTRSRTRSGSFPSIYYANGVWVTANRSTDGLYYSVDGMTWTRSSPAIDQIESIYYGNNLWVACSLYNGLYYSEDGKTWTLSNVSGISFASVYYGDGLWVASGYNSGLYYSLDGKVWTQSSVGGSFRKIYYANSIWVAAAYLNNGLYCSEPTQGKGGFLEYLVGDLESDYPDGGMKDGYYYEKVLPPVNPSEISWANGTDAQIAEMVAAADAGVINLSDYWSVGDTRTVQLSAMSATGVDESHNAQTVELVLMHAGGYDLNSAVASGRTKCSFVVGMKDCLVNSGYMNSSDTNSGSWDGSARRTWCNNVFKAAMPSSLLPIFKQFKTITAETYNGSTLKTSVDWFALPAAKEIFGGTATSAGTATINSNLTEFNTLFQFDWYKTEANRIKKFGMTGEAAYWWERSPYYNHSSHFCCVITGGGASAFGASKAIGISPFGCI